MATVCALVQRFEFVDVYRGLILSTPHLDCPHTPPLPNELSSKRYAKYGSFIAALLSSQQGGASV